MATKAKKTTSVKSAKKTTKKTPSKKVASAKSVATAKSEKTTKKVETKEVKVVKSSKRGQRRELTPMERIRSLHISNVIIFVIFGAVIYFLVEKISAEIFLNYQAKNVFVESGSTLVTANESLYSLDYRYYAIAILAVGVIGSLLLASSLRKAYEKSITAGVPGYRWAFAGLTFALLLSFVSFVAGVHDFATLKVVAGVALLAALIAWLSDRENMGNKTPKTTAFYISLIAYIVAFIPLVASLIGTLLYGAEVFEWYVYALSGIALLAVVANLVTQKTSITNKANLEYFAYEIRYIRINQVAMFLLVLVLVAALQK